MMSAKGLLQQNLPRTNLSRCSKRKLLDDLIGVGEQRRRRQVADQ
jgi:hypothetical protein